MQTVTVDFRSKEFSKVKAIVGAYTTSRHQSSISSYIQTVLRHTSSMIFPSVSSPPEAMKCRRIYLPIELIEAETWEACRKTWQT
eukprot:scaffold159148_cov13-Prasinocladus_malaysianus.AAC.1